MPGCRCFPPSAVAVAAPPRESLPPDLVGVLVSQARLDLPARSVSVSAQVQAHPVGTRPQSSLAAEEAGPRARGPRAPVDDRRRSRPLFWGARCEAALAPARASANPARGHGA